VTFYKTSDQQHKISNLSQKYLTKYYNILSAYYLKCSELETGAKKDELNMQASNYINKATDISFQDPSTCIIRGYSGVISGQIAQAEQEFDHAIHQNNTDILSLLGKAIVLFNKEKFDKALNLFQRVVKLNPLSPVSVYNASALCLYKLGNDALAKQIFEKVLEKEPMNENAL